ncbi:MAG: type IV pilus twitching motility protein PilT [Candidatus Dadabacteria bacterium]|nr:type IV pilus twitching motility protein PilT [Candidatus Dadabacteria bacterium]NIS08260.1 type IV pilus twitching motility protein PilT [Candidatus Dadabacteria bacterium]NIY21745.1 PilT/PilU family type 4a pilus ATPase [Candidatus Dadabacteria bacterium]
MASLNIDDLLKAALKVGASDIHLKTDSVPVFRVNGKLHFMKEAPVINANIMKSLYSSVMNKNQIERFERTFDIDLAYNIPDVSRFRVNVYQQRGEVSMAIRAIPYNILSFDDLNLPPILDKISMEDRGLVIVTGTTGSGKSTSLAAMVDNINAKKASHIITIEDPLEYTHRDKKSYINQREVGIDTLSFSNAMRASLREDPDVILIGEMRDLESIEIATAAAETGHLVFTTLHTLDAQETINRMLAVFPASQQNQIRYQLSQVLKAIVSQRLMPQADGKGRVPAVEVLLATSRIKDCIADPTKTNEIRQAIEEGHLHYGMQTFDQCLYNLFRQKLITYEEAMRQATNKDDLDLRIKGISSGSASLGRMDEPIQAQ